jgi:hypothetical protein
MHSLFGRIYRSIESRWMKYLQGIDNKIEAGDSANHAQRDNKKLRCGHSSEPEINEFAVLLDTENAERSRHAAA